MKYLIATFNPGKLRDFKRAFSDRDAELVSFEDFQGIEDIEETGETYLENASLKARHGYDSTGLPTFADDGGFEVDKLDGFPGLHSKRWVGEDYDDDFARAVGIFEKMNGVPLEKRSARLRSVVVFWDGEQLLSADNAIEGWVPEELDLESMEEGFPYRSLLYIPQFEKLYCDLTPDEHAQINHRRKSIEELFEKIDGLI